MQLDRKKIKQNVWQKIPESYAPFEIITIISEKHGFRKNTWHIRIYIEFKQNYNTGMYLQDYNMKK